MIWECWPWDNFGQGGFHNSGDGFAAPLRIVREDLNHNDGELWWIQRAYQHIAAVSSCLKCGAELDRLVRASNASGPSEGGVPGYVIETRCGGWRRHRLVAMVSSDTGDLVLGRFLTRGSAGFSIQDGLEKGRHR
jgi:hypothetical protein